MKEPLFKLVHNFLDKPFHIGICLPPKCGTSNWQKAMDVLEYIKEKKGKRLPESFKAPKVYNILPYLGIDFKIFRPVQVVGYLAPIIKRSLVSPKKTTTLCSLKMNCRGILISKKIELPSIESSVDISAWQMLETPFLGFIQLGMINQEHIYI